MRPTITLLSFYFYALLSSSSSSGYDRRWLVSLIDLVELDYEDHCEQRATATWNELIGAEKGLSTKLERDKAFGMFSREQAKDVKTAITSHSLGDDEVLRRKVKLILQPGDTLLNTEEWFKLVTFGDEAWNKLRFANNYYCGTKENCTLSGCKLDSSDSGVGSDTGNLGRSRRQRAAERFVAVQILSIVSRKSLPAPLSHVAAVQFEALVLPDDDFKMAFICLAALTALGELKMSLAKKHDEDTVHRMKESWESNLPPLNEYLDQILPLLKNASKENNYNTVEEYWDSLAEYEGAILKAREIWDSIKPLYTKLHKYVSLRLKGADAVGKPVSVQLLKSLNGEDWSNVIDKLLPKHPDVYKKLKENIESKHIGGLSALQKAWDLIKYLKLGDIDSQIFTDSYFNGTCPASIVDWCKPGQVKVVSCSDASVTNYIDVHETAMKIKYKQLSALHSNNTYLFREPSRYSAVYEAIPGFASLLALNPHALDRAGLYPIDRFNYNTNHHRMVLQLVMALRDLPRLNYYLAVDEWRLKVLKETIPSSKVPNSWSEFRNNFSSLETSNLDLLGDPYVLFNKPYIGKFMGLILKYQIYQAFAEELISDESDLIQYIAENKERLSDAMITGFGVIWPDVVSDLLAKRENALEYTAFTDYYRLLDEYLDNQLDPSAEQNAIDDYIEPVTSEPAPEENEIAVNEEVTIKPKKEQVQDHENILDNMIATGEETISKFGTETSTVGVLEIKNPVDKEGLEENTDVKEASYNTYWWIGIVVALAIVVILIAIIAKKRQNHRKELEKQRRDNSHA